MSYRMNELLKLFLEKQEKQEDLYSYKQLQAMVTNRSVLEYPYLPELEEDELRLIAEVNEEVMFYLLEEGHPYFCSEPIEDYTTKQKIALAKGGHRKEELKEDESAMVRLTLCANGYFLAEYIQDESERVRQKAKDLLESLNTTPSPVTASVPKLVSLYQDLEALLQQIKDEETRLLQQKREMRKHRVAKEKERIFSSPTE